MSREEYIKWQQALGCYIIQFGLSDHYAMREPLGEGSFGKVYLAAARTNSLGLDDQSKI